jgi:hypothetical protein
VSSDRRVRMLSPQLELAGEGFLFDLQSGRMRILRDVQARLLTLRDERSEN